MSNLTAFQEAAVNRIMDCFESKRGSHRYLLADEVGLGKTLVAQGVIETLNQKRSRAISVVYVCSNLEIAVQNRTKLLRDAKEWPQRLLLLALKSQEIWEARQKRAPLLFSFTPGTSLQFNQTTGTARERRLLLYLLDRSFELDITSPMWREFFRCSAGEERWHEATSRTRLRADFEFGIADDLVEKVCRTWDKRRLQDHCAEGTKPSDLMTELCKAVEAFRDNPEDNRKQRKEFIAALRQGLASVALAYLKPDLVILDEFQRFSDVLEETTRPGSVVADLFEKDLPVLIMSATPYRMFTQDFEDENHHRDFFRTLAFLKDTKEESSSLNELRSKLSDFEDRLRKNVWVEGTDLELLKTKKAIERELRTVMCRTERNWYLEDTGKGVCEVPANITSGQVPNKDDLVGYLSLRKLLVEAQTDDWNITDFWKSSPALLSFMDSDYKLCRDLKERPGLSKEMVPKLRQLPRTKNRNLKFRMLFDKVFAAADSKKKQDWPYLWTRPTYFYYQDRFFGDADPTKYLVFSHWRFVPKSIAVMASLEVEQRLGGESKLDLSPPLTFPKERSYYAFEVCWPSPYLADRVNVVELVKKFGAGCSIQKLRNEVKRMLRADLEKNGVKIIKAGGDELWQVVALLDGQTEHNGEIEYALEKLARTKRSEAISIHIRGYANRYLDWLLTEYDEISLSERNLDILVDIALFSPAVSALRAIRSVVDLGDHGFSHVVDLCLGSLRTYFNKPLVQRIIRLSKPGQHRYTRQVLHYCREAQLQATLDEYCYLLYSVQQVKEVEKLAQHIGHALGMWSGSPHVNELSRSGRLRSSRSVQTHFALAFGEEVVTEGFEEGEVQRSAVREAFNSPFWPFVLATTSVGQEGLDFHLYCRDIVHWNLPSNPVDLEQREGRINRFDGMCIRRNIATEKAHSIEHFIKTIDPKRNIWLQVFEHVSSQPHGLQRFKQGLFPHWVYTPQGEGVAGDKCATQLIRRHLLFYEGSDDAQRYQKLKSALTLYRLVFGQPRQQDVLERILKDNQGKDLPMLARKLRQYMINLTPMKADEIADMVKREIDACLQDKFCRDNLLAEVDHMVRNEYPKQLYALRPKIEVLKNIVASSGRFAGYSEKERRRAAYALAYLVNPYDEEYDFFEDVGLGDDVTTVQRTFEKIFPHSKSAQAESYAPI